MYKLIGSPKSRAFRVLWMLEELGVEYEWDKAGPRSEAVLAINPSGKIPVLIEDDEIMTDSAAIIQYLADRHGRFTSKPGTIARAKQDAVLHFAIDEMDGTCWAAAQHSFALPEALRVDNIKPACQYNWKRAMKTLERHLSDHKYTCGEDFRVPDIMVGHVLGWAIVAGFEIAEGRISEYFNTIRQRPAYMCASALRKSA